MHSVRVNDNNFHSNAPMHWIKENIGPSHYRTESGKREHIWIRRYYKKSIWIYSFKRASDATMFALRWA